MIKYILTALAVLFLLPIIVIEFMCVTELIVQIIEERRNKK